MYSSCRSVHLAASSVEIAWFCPSGSSVTRNVERFERASTCVCTFRLSYFVERAVGIFAVSSLTSSGLGFSITRFACGSRNSIFATLVSSFSTAWARGVYPRGEIGPGLAAFPSLAFVPVAAHPRQRPERRGTLKRLTRISADSALIRWVVVLGFFQYLARAAH